MPRHDETHTPHIAVDDHQHKEPLRRGLAKARKRELRLQDRRRYEKDWLAPAGSELEKQFLRRWVQQDGLSKEDRDLIHRWISNPDEFAKRNALFWQAAKKSLLGAPVYNTAIDRHKKLDSKEWLVAFCTAQGIRQKEIAELTHMGERMVDNTIRSLKDKISREFQYEIEIVDRVHIARWFFGL